MKIKVLENHLNAPLCVYDGPEPKEIVFRFIIGDCELMIDLWSIANKYWDNPLPIEKLIELNESLNFPRKYLMKQWEFVSHVEDGPIYFGNLIGSNSTQEILVYFTLFEKQPSRYQCYVLAVLTTEV